MRYYSVSTHYSANTNFFLGALPPDPLIYPSCLHSIDQEIQISNSLWGFSPRPLIYPSFLHSIDHEILLTTAQISNIFRGGGFTPRLSYLSFLFTFNKPWDTRHYSTNIRDLPPEQFNLRERVLQVAQVQKIILYKRCKIVFIDAQKSKIFRLGLRPSPRP